MKRIKNHYVITSHFDGQGHGAAWGFDYYPAAVAFAVMFLFGFAEVITEAELEERFPSYFHNLVSQTY